MSTDYGTDWSTFPDLDASFAPLTGLDAIGQAVVRSLMDARFGIDLRLWLNDDVTQAKLYELQQTIERQVSDDERIDQVTATVSQPDPLSLAVDLDLVPADGSTPFRLTLSVTKLSVELLTLEAIS